MNKVTLTVDGMACNMCEAHVCDAIRKVAEKKAKISASHVKGTAEVITEGTPDVEAIKSAVNATGYTVVDAKVEPYEKKGLFKH